MKTPLFALAAFIVATLLISPQPSAQPAPQSSSQSPVSTVTISEVDEVIPTYAAGPPDPNPMFFFGRQSQGAEGRVYPYPLYDNLTHAKSDWTYRLVYLENEYVKIGILPEIGGRIFSGVDKTNGYDFIYRQHVVKPALIGLIGAWISGGVEWNTPHHHRASTFTPVQWSREDHPDGSKTVWVGELEIRHRMRWAVGYTLRPGSSVLECAVRIANRTPLVNTMLCFANVAVHANEDYQVIFPPRTQWSTGHGKRAFQPWPAPAGADMSWYKNNRASASWFAVNDTDDFIAGYDHGRNAGVMSVADRHVVPGKKFFTWGVGSMWDRILTDDDGPYLEIMVGAFSDNQPDYSWIQPFETRSFIMSWYPFRGIEGAKNANLDAAVNLDVKGGEASFGFYATRAYRNASVTLKAGTRTLVEETISIDPGNPYFRRAAVPAGVDEHDLRASISAEGKDLVAYSPVRLAPAPQPAGTTNPGAPEDIDNDEELFLAGQRIWQFHNPTLDPDPYWEEALRRDPDSVAANTGMGILNLKKAEYAAAEEYLRRAAKRLTAQYTAPKDVEAFYYLGVALKAQGRLDDAYAAFYKAVWSQEWKAAAYYSLAEIAMRQGDAARALSLVDQSLDANVLSLRAYGLKAAALRQQGRGGEAARALALAREKTDPLDARIMAEQWLLAKGTDGAVERALFETLISHPVTALEIAAEYLNCGLWGDGRTVLEWYAAKAGTSDGRRLGEGRLDTSGVSPIVYYYLGHFAEQLGDAAAAAEYRNQAALQPPEYVFPFQEELIEVLGRAIAANPRDARAPYYLGNLLYDGQPEAAIGLWEKAAALDPAFPITWRNLAVAYSHRPDGGEGSIAKAIACLEKAVTTRRPYPTHFVELDRLYQATNASVEKRLALLEKNQGAVVRHDEALGRLITLKVFAGKAEESIELLSDRIFSIWEGGTPFNSGQAWADAHVVQGLRHLKERKHREAVASFEAAFRPPENLRAEQRFDQRYILMSYWAGVAYDALGDKIKARAAWHDALNPGARTLREGVAGGGVAAGGGMGSGGAAARGAGGVSLAQGEQRYYQALARRALGETEGVEAVFRELIASAEAALSQTAGTETDRSQLYGRPPARSNAAVARYVAGLGYAGLGDKKKAREEFIAALAISADYLNARLALDYL